MQRIHLLRVEAPPTAFAPLFAAAAQRRERLGWLDLEAAELLPPGIAGAAAAGAKPAVEVTAQRVTAVRVLDGPPVLRDLLRRDFLGCRAVLVRGAVEAPLLVAEAGRWRVIGPGKSCEAATEEALLDALRRPRPWG